MSEFRISPESGIVFQHCPECYQELTPSYNGWRRHLEFCDHGSIRMLKREAVLSALDDLETAIHKEPVFLSHDTVRTGVDNGRWFVYRDSVLALIDASRSALETPKP